MQIANLSRHLFATFGLSRTGSRGACLGHPSMYIELYFEVCTITEQITGVPFSTDVTVSLDHY